MMTKAFEGVFMNNYKPINWVVYRSLSYKDT